ncbi:sigma-70 family RNA polymerase sigma factor [Microbacterium sp. Au-Mic1]|uniref:RNA polymerase sigma factor n=1 Tax=Microbacterium sp. Au-Mic1 TaxID=2906457 RepID=UPI001E42029B|nr:sigma-70 family RNA polymerase sigma factor [Microbacterium sp. Au-Mic1]MCE4025253.1 sigma-70 family RNA polymerase sigma factor [Microbacterium sp. Au-Mic1]
MTDRRYEDLWRSSAPQVLAALLRRYGAAQLDLCEDAVQEALLAAHQQWPAEGAPADAKGWLLTVARRRMIDRIRSEHQRRERENAYADAWRPLAEAEAAHADDSVEVLRLCCHPALTMPAQVALTLRAVAGLSTAQIARAHLLPEATIAQRISRAKARIRVAGAVFPEPSDPEDRLDPVLAVLYVMFTEGHTATEGADANDIRLSDEAIRLARMLHRERPEDVEVAGLLALMLLTDARRAARIGTRGELIPLDEQDRTRWDRDGIEEGTGILDAALAAGRHGPYSIQAAIAALHDDAPSTATTDWPQILALYRLLERETGNPVATINRAVAQAMVHGPESGLAVIDSIADARVRGDRKRIASVRAHLLERAGRTQEAIGEYLEAARATLSVPERDYLRARAARLRG